MTLGTINHLSFFAYGEVLLERGVLHRMEQTRSVPPSLQGPHRSCMVGLYDMYALAFTGGGWNLKSGERWKQKGKEDGMTRWWTTSLELEVERLR